VLAVLRDARAPMHVREIWQKLQEQNVLVNGEPLRMIDLTCYSLRPNHPVVKTDKYTWEWIGVEREATK
jgi:hypothetical protein